MFRSSFAMLKSSLVLLSTLALTASSLNAQRPTIDTPHRLVFQAERGGGIDVWVMNADGSDARNLTNNGDFNDRHPTASTDRIVMAARTST